ncbi:hypothetical protein LXL04_039205 [Taraxacum kok-saghyz]
MSATDSFGSVVNMLVESPWYVFATPTIYGLDKRVKRKMVNWLKVNNWSTMVQKFSFVSCALFLSGFPSSDQVLSFSMILALMLGAAFFCTPYIICHTSTALIHDADPTGESAGIGLGLFGILSYGQGCPGSSKELTMTAGSDGRRVNRVGIDPDETGLYGATGRMLPFRELLSHIYDEWTETRGMRVYDGADVERFPILLSIWSIGETFLRAVDQDCSAVIYPGKIGAEDDYVALLGNIEHDCSTQLELIVRDAKEDFLRAGIMETVFGDKITVPPDIRDYSNSENIEDDDMKDSNENDDASVSAGSVNFHGATKIKKKIVKEKMLNSMNSMEIKTKKNALRAKILEADCGKESEPMANSTTIIESDQINQNVTKMEVENVIGVNEFDNLNSEAIHNNKQVKDQLEGIAAGVGLDSILGIKGGPILTFPNDGPVLLSKLSSIANSSSVFSFLKSEINNNDTEVMNAVVGFNSNPTLAIGTVIKITEQGKNQTNDAMKMDDPIHDKNQMDPIIDTEMTISAAIQCIVNLNPELDPKSSTPKTSAQMLQSKNPAVNCKIKILPKDPKNMIGVVEMPVENLVTGSVPYQSTLIGYFIDRKLAFPTVRYFVNKMWKQFGLEDLMDVMENGPWLINDVPLFVQKWKPGLVLSKPEINMVPVWVKIYNVPLEYWNENGVAYISNEVGRPIIMDRITQRMCEEHGVRRGAAMAAVAAGCHLRPPTTPSFNLLLQLNHRLPLPTDRSPPSRPPPTILKALTDTKWISKGL